MRISSNSSRRRRGRQAVGGFTLIELIVVITILGVLAAVALPRFTSLQADARKAKADAIFGSIRAASAIVKSTALVKGVSCSDAAVTSSAPASGVVLEGRPIDMSYCYPIASTTTTAGILGAANVDPTADNVTISGSGSNVVVTIAGGGTGCTVSYTSPTGADLPPTITNNATAAGC